jgi:hypothetical protein
MRDEREEMRDKRAPKILRSCFTPNLKTVRRNKNREDKRSKDL